MGRPIIRRSSRYRRGHDTWTVRVLLRLGSKWLPNLKGEGEKMREKAKSEKVDYTSSKTNQGLIQETNTIHSVPEPGGKNYLSRAWAINPY